LPHAEYPLYVVSQKQYPGLAGNFFFASQQKAAVALVPLYLAVHGFAFFRPLLSQRLVSFAA
jgi:hypothetical protein